MKALEKSEGFYYTPEFYASLQSHSRNSAEVIVPILLEILECKSVVDIGCGDGTWLKVFQESGVEVILGIDGSYVDSTELVIPQQAFRPFDLKLPLNLEQTFNLVMSLEVAEHLPEECAETFIDSLTRLGKVVFFSAAIPEQGGVNHINEKWQDYWALKFYSRGYRVFCYVREKVWENSKVAHCYAQNNLLCVDSEYFEKNLSLKDKIGAYEIKKASFASIVHPQEYLNKLKQIEDIRKSTLRYKLSCVKQKLKNAVGI